MRAAGPMALTGGVLEYLEAHDRKSLLRFITCGSVDDGKSTLIGRLLYETKAVYHDHLVALESDSIALGTQNGDIDFALLVDGLAAEREQGITIDVAYRYFTTELRKFIVADTPGHEQYTRNMVTGASTADAAVILVDATKGVLTQTRRHAYLVSLLGIRNVILAVNKLDLLGYAEEPFARITAEFDRFAASLALSQITAIPVSALRGDNITVLSPNTPWYAGPALLPCLEVLEIDSVEGNHPFRMPVQTAVRPDAQFRGFAGTVVRGTVRPGDAIRVVPSGQTSVVARIVTFDGDLEVATVGQSVTLALADEIDVSRGDVIASAGDAPAAADHFEVTVVWMAEEPMFPGRSYLLKIGAQWANASVGDIKYRVDVNTLQHSPAKQLALNEIAVCTLDVDRVVPFDPYRANRDMGGFILVDRLTNATQGAGMIHFALRRSDNVHWQALDVDRAARAQLKGHRPCVVWLTGLSGAGKSTIANLVERRLHRSGVHTALLDGDNVRHGLSRDLGFSAPDRVENNRRVAEVSRLLSDAGLVVLVSFISPFANERQFARSLMPKGEFCEVFVDVPLDVAEQRDTKGLYGKARRGELPNFTGIDSPFEVPQAPELHLRTAEITPDEAAAAVISHLRVMGVIG